MIKQRPASPARQRGLALVEFAMCGLLLVTLLTFPLFFSRYFMHYTVAQKAARDAAIYMARLPQADMKNADFTHAAEDVATDMATAQMASLRPGRSNSLDFGVTCDDGPCGDGVPDRVRVHVRMRVYDDFFWMATTRLIGDEGVRIRASVQMDYIGQ